MRREPRQERGKVFDTPFASALHHTLPFRGRVQTVNTPVVGVPPPSHEPSGFERLDDARHRRRPDLLGRRELPERPRASEDEHRKCRQLRRRNSCRRILPTHVPQSVDCGRVEAIGGVD